MCSDLFCALSSLHVYKAYVRIWCCQWGNDADKNCSVDRYQDLYPGTALRPHLTWSEQGDDANERVACVDRYQDLHLGPITAVSFATDPDFLTV